MVIWLIGMSASGKTTIGKELYAKLKTSNEKWVFIDGDAFRNILGNDLGHSIEDRRINAYRISRFCELLSSQNINVLASVLSIFHDNQQYNRENIPNYKEVFIDVDFETLKKRDNKNLYQKAIEGKIKNVVGIDIEFKPPILPNLVIENNKQITDFSDITNKIIEEFNISINASYHYTNSNLLETPQKYQYSNFEGAEFFIKFSNDRNKTLDFIEKRLMKLKSNNLIQSELIKENYLLNDNLVLKHYLQFLLTSKNDVLVEHTELINILIKRFEVSKKLYEIYNIKTIESTSKSNSLASHMFQHGESELKTDYPKRALARFGRFGVDSTIKKSSSNFSELINYSNFSLLLQRYYKIGKTKEVKMIYFNSILKLNDILSSVKDNLILPLELELTKKAIIGELRIAESFIK